MCALQPEKPRKELDEDKRERVDAARQDTSLTDEQVRRLARKHLPWKDWIVQEYLPYWYWLGVLGADLFLLLDAAQRYHVRDLAGIAVLIAAFAALVILEYKLFQKLWPKSVFSKLDEEF